MVVRRHSQTTVVKTRDVVSAQLLASCHIYTFFILLYKQYCFNSITRMKCFSYVFFFYLLLSILLSFKGTLIFTVWQLYWRYLDKRIQVSSHHKNMVFTLVQFHYRDTSSDMTMSQSWRNTSRWWRRRAYRTYCTEHSVCSGGNDTIIRLEVNVKYI